MCSRTEHVNLSGGYIQLKEKSTGAGRESNKSRSYWRHKFTILLSINKQRFPKWTKTEASEEINNDVHEENGLNNVLQEILNYKFNNDIVNNKSATGSVAFTKHQDLFTSAKITFNENITINFGKE